jgi:chromosome segregation ATPase
VAIEDQIRDLRTSISQAQSTVTRAQVGLETAKARQTASDETLRSFGVESKEDARTKLEELQAELDAAVADVEAKLQEAGA